jgi:hypothetical protein
MGYEIKYYYKESADELGTYKDEIISKTSKVGKFEEEVSLDVLAGKIMAQLARRNILIVDIEIFEFTKKKISYKETESGILIKNKKFSFDSGAVIQSESESEEDEDLEKILQNESLILKLKSILSPGFNTKKNIAPRATNQNSSKKIIRKEVYDPEIINKHKIEQRGLRFTVGKQYPIYSEKNVGVGVINYLTVDDTGREVEIISDCFVATSVGLSFQDAEPQYFGAEGNNEINLWNNVQVENNVPDIRRK